MTIQEAIPLRHAVRSYTDKPVEEEKLQQLRQLIDKCNDALGLHIQMVVGDPKAFDSRLAHYGKFQGVSNYIAMIGTKDDDLDEMLGYAGEHLVLFAQTLGIDTCWVGLTFKKNPEVLQIDKGERVRCVIPFGYGQTQGVVHKVKTVEQVSRVDGPMPAWFRRGVEAALLAPTAMNQQKFTFSLVAPNVVEAKAGWGFFTHVDLGIVKYHFEIGAGRENFTWKEKV